ncbi:hypothetical protein [Plebeiibacterium marinum]|uniref:DUF4890 domain-containing protein n=1 Tax=Plebeiibacterium marinum TaxID=2992111 RepID=A0AAE3SLR2_9BACT|nr:hypothetical protein [Plebeiobacterium marinum]MCW3806755.1 hypothetical protein [Plebeiobacterium marinum]
MKNLVFIAILILSLSTQLTAQRPQRNMDPVERSKKQTERMKELLELSDEQAVKIQEINLDFAKQVQEMRKNNTDREAMRESMQTLRAEHKEQMKKVLNEEQYQKMLEDEKKMQERRMQGHQGGKYHQ